jgi:aldose 1-epimerase
MSKETKRFCFKHPSGEDIYLFTLRNTNGTEVCISNYGAIITSFKLLLIDHTFNDIVLGFDDMESYCSAAYLANYPYFGAVIGRYANRIKDASFRINGHVFHLAKNKGTDHIHGGLEGFDRKVWSCSYFSDEELLLTYTSKDGEEGYPGTLQTEIHFRLNEENELTYEIKATTDKATAVNLTHHSYFNLNNGKGSIADHFITIDSEAILEQDSNLVVNGRTTAVSDTIYDFRKEKKIQQSWNALDGYDQSYVLGTTVNRTREDGLVFAASAYSNLSGVRLEVYTSEPLVHFYTGKWIPSITGKHQTAYQAFSGFCFETQKHPNAVNIAQFPNTILQPGETYYTKTLYRVFQVSKS